MAVLHINHRSYRVQGILFDKDGTLLDFTYLWATWSKLMSDCLQVQVSRFPGIPISKNHNPSFKTEIAGPMKNSIGYDPNGPLAMGSTDEMLTILAWQAYSRGIPWNDAKRVVEQCHQLVEEQLERLKPAKPLPGLVRFLQECGEAGIPMAVVTADDTEPAVRHLQWMGIDRHFAVIVGNDQVTRGKPDAEMILTACRSIGLNPSETAIIGDTEGDMLMGKAAGVAVTIGIRSAAALGERHLKHADERISDFSGLKIEKL
ncbi:HAD family hydrolase [Ferviditalea candida]|uniref:HAD family hydrolase n=1 Tax=Ferviditalea candida TaxID=3108399 RepID=A0ABU5ZQB7_9BACL|nr:HAD family hydrolase [Paenibacillaceae bacterium T2]